MIGWQCADASRCIQIVKKKRKEKMKTMKEFAFTPPDLLFPYYLHVTGKCWKNLWPRYSVFVNILLKQFQIFRYFDTLNRGEREIEMYIEIGPSFQITDKPQQEKRRVGKFAAFRTWLKNFRFYVLASLRVCVGKYVDVADGWTTSRAWELVYRVRPINWSPPNESEIFRCDCRAKLSSFRVWCNFEL